MNLLSLLGISKAYAATAVTTAAPVATAAPQGSPFAFPLILVGMLAFFYFLMIRPQQKRAKEQRQLMDNLTVNDEVLTTGGVVGRIVKLRDNYVVLNIGKEVEITFQKGSVAAVLPKGTMDNI